MNVLKKVFDFYIYSNIHVAIAAFSLVKVTLLGITAENDIPLFVFFSTVFSYNLIRFFSNVGNELSFSKLFEYNKKSLLFLSLISFAGMLFILFQHGLENIQLLLLMGVVTMLYGLPIDKHNSKLRNVKYVKIFLIAFVYAIITVVWPLQNYAIEIGSGKLVYTLQRFLFILLLTLPFDIRDLVFDSNSLQTLPQLLGVRKTKYFGLLLFLLISVLEFCKSVYDLPFVFISFLALILLILSSDKQSKYYASFWVEGIPILWLVLEMIYVK